MATFFWGVPPGTAGDFNDASNWFETVNQQFGIDVPGEGDTANVVAPVHLVVEPDKTNTVSRLQVLFQSKDEEVVRIEGNLRVVDEVFFENDRGTLRFSDRLVLDGTTVGATMDVDLILVGAVAPNPHRNAITFDDGAAFVVAGNAQVTTRDLDVVGKGELDVTNGGSLMVAGSVSIVQDGGAPSVEVEGFWIEPGSGTKTGSAFLIDGDLTVDGTLLVYGLGRARAQNVTINSDSSALLRVGSAQGGGMSSRFDVDNMTLGDGVDGRGQLVVTTDGQVFIEQTLTLLDATNGGSASTVEVSTAGNGFIEIGGTQGADPHSIVVRPAGFSAGLIGHGFVETGTFQNDGIVLAEGGLLFINADVTGSGFFGVADNSALEIGGSFGESATVVLGGSARTLILDSPSEFEGSISSLNFTTTIQLNNTGSAFDNHVYSVVVTADSANQHYLTLFQDNVLSPINYRISATVDLTTSRFDIAESTDGKSTTLTLTDHGTITNYYLNATGQIDVIFLTGDDQGANTNVYINPDGSVTGDASGFAAELKIFDFKNQQLNGFRHVWTTDQGQAAFVHYTFDNNAIAAIDEAIATQVPTSPNPAFTHNLWYFLRHNGLATTTIDDGKGGYFDVTFDGGTCTFISVDPAITAIPAALASEMSLASPLDGAGSVQAPPPGPLGFSVGSQTFNPQTRVLTAFVTYTYFQGEVEMRQSWVHNGDGSYTRSDTFPEFPSLPPTVGVFDADFMRQTVLPLIASYGSPTQPIVAGTPRVGIATNISGTLVGTQGTPLTVLTGQLIPGAVLIGDGGGTLIGQEGANLITDHGAALIGNDAANLIGNDAANLVMRDTANIISRDGAGIVAGGGLNLGLEGAAIAAMSSGALIAPGGANLINGIGGNLIAGGGGKTVDAGGGNFLKLWGTGTPGRYVANAVVFADANGNGKADNGEAWTITDANGQFELFGGWGTLVMAGGTDTGTNLPFTAVLKAPLGSTDISSLTTLASGLAADDGDIDGAIKQLQAAMGLDMSLDFTVIDPIASTENGDPASAKIHVEMSKTLDAVLLIGAAFAGMGADQSAAQDAAFAAMVEEINKSNTLNLSDKGTVVGLIAAVGASLAIDASKIVDAVAGTIVSTGQLLDKLLVDEGAGTGLTSAITMVETGVQGGLVTSLKAAAGDPGKLGPAVVLLDAKSDDGNGIVTPAEVVTITVTTSESVTVTGAPTLQLSNGKAASFVGGSGGNSLVFEYVAQAGEGAGPLDVTGLALGKGGGITDTSGNALAGTVGGALGLTLDTGALVTVSALDADRAEGSSGGTTPFTFSLTRTGDTSVEHSVSWSIVGSGIDGADPSDIGGTALNGGTVTFAAGETVQTVTIEVVGDTEVEADEEFLLSIFNPTAGLVVATSSATGTIRNDDATVSIAAVAVAQAEGTGGQTGFNFILTRDGDASVTHSVTYTVAGSGAVPADIGDFLDVALPTDTVTFAPGQTAMTVVVQVIGDTALESDEDFTVTLSDPSLGLVLGTASAAVTIQNDDGAVVSISTLSAMKAEQDSGLIPFTFLVTLGEASAIAQSVDWALTGTGATPADGADFEGGVLPSGSLTFAPDETAQLITVMVAGDRAVEPDDFFVVTLSNPSNGLSLAAASAFGIVQNDDRATVSIAALSAGKAEGDVGTTPFTFTVSLDQAPVVGQSVGWSVAGSGGQAADAADFGGAMPTGAVSFAPGEILKTITVGVSGDMQVEADETFAVTLVDLSAGLAPGTSSATGAIDSDDSVAVSIAALSAVKPEGTGGTTAYTFTVSLSQAGLRGLTVDWSVDGSGQSPAAALDFGTRTGTVSFAVGETIRTITVSVVGDTDVERDEEFTVSLSNPAPGLEIGAGTATGTIVNDDLPRVAVYAYLTTKAEGSSGTTPFVFTIGLAEANFTGGQTVAWSIAGSGANPANAADFAGATSGTVTYAPGEAVRYLTIDVVGDVSVEPDEGFAMTLSNPSGLTLGDSTATGTIQNDDAGPAPAVVAHDDAYIVLEGRPLTAPVGRGVLANDENASTASLLSGPGDGTLQIVGNGSFGYTPAAGFTGIDSFTYRAGNSGSSTADAQASIFVVPVNVGETTTLDLLSLSAEEQIAATYIAFFGRAADRAGFGFWVGEFVSGLPVQGPAMLFANIASSFGISDEAQALYPFLANPFGASDGQISAFLDSVYNNLFNRGSDPAGLAYWTGETKATLLAGRFVGSILVNIMSGAQDTAAGQDITTLMGKVAVSLDYVQEQHERNTGWLGASDVAAATALLDPVTSDPLSVLTGIRNAEDLIAAHP